MIYESLLKIENNHDFNYFSNKNEGLF
jgi:hypothetical protein